MIIIRIVMSHIRTNYYILLEFYFVFVNFLRLFLLGLGLNISVDYFSIHGGNYSQVSLGTKTYIQKQNYSSLSRTAINKIHCWFFCCYRNSSCTHIYSSSIIIIYNIVLYFLIFKHKIVVFQWAVWTMPHSPTR